VYVCTYINIHLCPYYHCRKMLFKVSKGRLNKLLHPALAQLVADIEKRAVATNGEQCLQTSQHMHLRWQLSLLDIKALLTLLAPMKASICHSDLCSTSILHNAHTPCKKLIMPDGLLYATIGNKTLTSCTSRHNTVIQ